MEQPQFIKCEPDWLSDSRESYNLESNEEAASDKIVEVKCEPADMFSYAKIENSAEELIKQEHELQDVKEEAQNEGCISDGSPCWFPFKRPEILKKWTLAVRRKNWEPTRYSYLCSEHFSSECYIPGKNKDKPLLKGDAVPDVRYVPLHLTSKRKRPASPISDHSPPKVDDSMGEPSFIKCEPDWSDEEESQTVEAINDNVVEVKIEPDDVTDDPSEEAENKDLVKEELHIQESDLKLSSGNVGDEIKQDIKNVVPKNEEIQTGLFDKDGDEEEGDVKDALCDDSNIHGSGFQPSLYPNSAETKTSVDETLAEEATASCNVDLTPLVLVQEGITTMCRYCGKTFKSEFHMEEHMSKHFSESDPSQHPLADIDTRKSGHSKKTLRFCSECGKSFAKPYALQRHIHAMHGEKPHSCPTCDMKFAHSCRLREHLLIHSGENPHVCDICGKTFKKRGNLNVHQRVHTGERPHVCTTCGKALTTSTHLYRHMLTHTGVKPHVCLTCGRAFTHRGSLNEHQLSHTGEKPFACNSCTETFARRSCLIRHMMTHTGVKPYPCKICSKTFASRSNLTLHMSTHTGELPYVCSECGKAFATTFRLGRHVLTHSLKKKRT